MRAVVYKGPFRVAVENVPDPQLKHPNDAIVKITSSCICGSDLHMYEGRTAAKPGIVFGHENMGIIQEVGSAVTTLKAGDRVVMPFNVACGFCKNCQRGFTGFCTTVNPGFAGGAYGYVAMGPWGGGQAEYLQVPYADFNCLPLPPGRDLEADFALLADIFPTGYHGAELAGVSPGESVAVFGAGPVGLMAAYKGPFRVAVENVPDPQLKHPNDAIVKITSSCICGSDLHMYEGRTAAKPGIVFGHENMGIIQEVGSAVTTLKAGDRVVMPFNVACGFCKNCQRGFTGFCTTVNPGFAGGAYGYVAMGPWGGGQAEYLQVPYADFNCLPLPPGRDLEADFALLADIFPTGYHGAELAGVSPGESVAVFGAGPVGLMAAYKGPFRVAVENVPDPQLKHPNDAIVKITSSCICGSDLHMYEGRTAAKPGIVFGHENMGIIQEVGSAVTTLKAGDRVVMPFNVACGFCKNCQRGFTGFCTTVNPGFAGGAYGYVAMGPWGGGQAEYLQVPYADFNCLPLPPGRDLEADFALLADIFPTGYHGAELAGVSPGESVAVFGAGPVGLMAAYSCVIRGAAEVYAIDHVTERLDKAAEIGAIPINFDHGNPVDQIKSRRKGDEVDKGIDAVGYQAAAQGSSAAGGEQEEVPNIVLNQVIDVVNPTGALGIPGLYVPTDPGGVDEDAKRGALSINFGKLFEKGLRLGTGQCNVKRYNAYIRDLIIAGKAKPSFVVSHEVPLEDAVSSYEKFDKRVEGYTKVILNS